MTLLALANILQLSTAVTAAVLCFRRRSYRTVALLFVAVALADWLRLWLDLGILRAAPRPRTGMTRLAYHLDQALFLVWPAGLAAVAGWVFGRRRPLGVAVAYGATLATLVLGYPRLRQEALAVAYFGIHALAFGYALTCALRRFTEETIQIEHVTVIFSTVLSLAALLGPYTGRDWIDRWRMAQFANVVLYAILTYHQGALLWGSSRSSSS